MMYRVHDWDKFNYSRIKQYIGEGYTDKSLRNDEIVDLLNSQRQWIEEQREIILGKDKIRMELLEEIEELKKEVEYWKQVVCQYNNEEEVSELSEETIDKFKQDLKDGNFVEFTAR